MPSAPFKLLPRKILPNEPGLTTKRCTKEMNQAVKQLFDQASDVYELCQVRVTECPAPGSFLEHVGRCIRDSVVPATKPSSLWHFFEVLSVMPLRIDLIGPMTIGALDAEGPGST